MASDEGGGWGMLDCTVLTILLEVIDFELDLETYAADDCTASATLSY